MNNVDDILYSMLENMKNYENEYNEVTVKINTIIKDYSAKIDELQKQRLALQDEGNKKIDLLNAKKEQLSGKYSSLYEQYKKFANKEPDFNELLPEKKSNSEPVKSNSKRSAKKEVIKKEETNNENKVEASISNSLSPDEIAKLSEIVDNKDITQKPKKDVNGNEIPEYLQDAYTK